MAVSKRLRFEILRRDNHTCQYCGATPPNVELVVDHVMPDVLGGKPEPANLVTACEPCNSGKSSMPPDAAIVEGVASDALRWARAMDAARAQRAAMIAERNEYADRFHELWSEFGFGWGPRRKPIPLDDDWVVTLAKFFEYEVDWADIDYAVRAAMGAQAVTPDNTFRYFCGVVWNIIRDLEAEAGAIARGDTSPEPPPATDTSWISAHAWAQM